MEHLLRVGVSHRISRLVLRWAAVERVKTIQNLPRLLSSQKFSPDEDSTPDNQITSLVDKRFTEDLNKFKNENKLSLPRSAVQSEDFVAGPKDDPNTFGTLQKNNPYLENFKEGSTDDQEEDEYLSQLPNYLPQKEYAKQIKKFLAQRRFADALDVLQVTMLKEHRVKPEYFIYAILIHHCGQTGYSKMAFKLFNNMKKRGLTVPSSIYTSLFNSCANSPFPSDGLRRTRHLFSLMNEKGIQPNDITCHSIIKAFSKCGSLEEAFKVVDYMMERKLALSPDTMNNLLLACRSDPNAGFRHALLVYKKLGQYRLKPDIYHFNLLINCARDCGIGDTDSAVDFFKLLGVNNAEQLEPGKFKAPQLDSGYAWEESEKVAAETVAGTSKRALTQPPQSSVDNPPSNLLPNLLSRHPSLGGLVSVSEIATRQDRLFILGGVEGFLKEMTNHHVKPDIRTASLLLDCSPDSCAAENHLLKIISKLEVTPDLVFFNSLILRRIKRKQYSEAKDVLALITSHGLQPDLQTYTNLAMTCRTLSDAYELLQAVDASGVRPGIEFATAMLGCATTSNNLKYINLVLDVIKYEEMEVNSRFLHKLEVFHQKCQNILKIRPAKFTPHTLDAMQLFCKNYPKWKAEVKVEVEKHPWDQFRERYSSNTKTDETYLEKYVEPNALKTKFPHLGPNAAPVVRRAKLKQLKEQNPEMFQGKGSSKKIFNRLRGFENVVVQEDQK